jgi:5-methylcytosine-specific restriction endonuclease McrBC regulatory subunit McrC
MAQFNLTDNTRYYLDHEEEDQEKSKKYLSGKSFGILEKLPNPLTTSNLEGVEVISQKNSDENENLIFKIVTKNGQKYLQTGNMIGEFYYKHTENTIHTITIGLRFDKDGSTNILEYLLNYANEIYPSRVDFSTKDQDNKKKSNNIIKILLSNLFTHSLSKAFVMGLPTEYRDILEHDYNVRGRIDLNRLVSKELPFKGKTPTVRHERVIVNSIAIVLLKVINIIQNQVDVDFPNLSKVKSTLKQSNISNIISVNHIREALNHRVLQHPSFYEYKNTMFLATLMLKGFKTPKIAEMRGLYYGYLVDISKIWENYLVKLIGQHISAPWAVEPEPELKLFETRPNFLNYYANVMRPDIVVENEAQKKIMVFDAKFKQSQYFNREDYYKTASYVSYYQNHGWTVILCGQIYPDINLNEINKNVGFLDSGVDFSFFGIDLTGTDFLENAFIVRILKYFNEDYQQEQNT